MLPSRLKSELFRRLLGWQIGPNTRIGLSFIWCRQVQIGANVTIGHLNWFRGLKFLSIGSQSEINNLNDFGADPKSDWPARLEIGEGSHITSRHFFDCSGIVHIGNYTCVGGRGCQFWSHYLSIENPRKPYIVWRELVVGDYCYIGANATLVYCRVPNHSIVAAGAVVNHKFSRPGLLIAGNPARGLPRVKS